MDTTPIFDRIAKRYNFLNHLFSLGFDIKWRKECVRCLYRENREGKLYHLIDLACGTGDLSMMLYKKGFKVTGIDISEQMLRIAIERKKRLKGNIENISNLSYIQADALTMPFDDGGADILTIAYGIRNFDKRAEALKEINRVLKVGGKLVILEFGEPENSLLKSLYNFYFKRIMPFIARLVIGKNEGGAYNYFYNSVSNFPKFEKFCLELEKAGFKDVKYKKQSLGISVMYMATK